MLVCCSYSIVLSFLFFFFNDTATTEIYTLSLHDALPISGGIAVFGPVRAGNLFVFGPPVANHHQAGLLVVIRSEEHTSELQSLRHLVCRLLLEKKKNNNIFLRRKLH